MAGQARALTDLALLPPADESAQQHAAELYQFVYYRAGGFSRDDILRSETLMKTMFQMLETWQPVYSETYDPGWRVERYPPTEKYVAQLRYSKQVRRAQLEHLALLKRDAEYRKVDDELQALLRAHNNVIQEPGAAEQYAELSQQLREIAAKYPGPAIPEQPEILRFEYEPDPDAGFRQLLSGLDGPDESRIEVFEGLSELQESWLANALDAEELAKIASEVNFDEEVIMAISVGERANASGRTVVTDAVYGEKAGHTRSAIMVGVYAERCGVPEGSYFPFAVVAVTRGQGLGVRSSSISNFPDTCPGD